MTHSEDDSTKLPLGKLEPQKAQLAGTGLSLNFDPWGVRGFWQSYFENLKKIAVFRWDEHHLGGVSYVFAKGLAAQMAQATPMAFRTELDSYLKKPSTQTMLRSKTMADIFEAVGQQIEAIKRSRRAFGLPVVDAELFGEPYNHHFLAEDVHGNIVPVSEEQLLALFPPPDPVSGKAASQMPHVVITASHASGETLKDVTQITHGIERTISEATQNKTTFAKVDVSRSDLGVAPDQTLILFRCDVRENPWLNGAALLRRMNELKANEQTGKPDQFKETSPGAWAINHLMLAWMAQEPEQILSAKNKPLAEALGANNAPIELRPDAARIAQHIMLEGYSKAGNVVSDAGPRLLPHELLAKNKNGQDIFFTEQDSQMQPISKDGIYEAKKIIQQIPTWAMAAVEFGLTDEQIAVGSRRVAFNSTADQISAHSNYEGRRHDERWMIKGVTADNGHAPVAALGSREETGYAMKDPRVRRRMEELCAPMIGKATLEGIYFDRGSANEVYLEIGAGTTDRIVRQHHQTILDALDEAGLKGAELTSTAPYAGEFLLKFPYPVSNNPEAMQKLERAFQALRQDAPGLVICERLLNEDLASQLRVAGGKINEAEPTVSEATLAGARMAAAPAGRARGGSEKRSGDRGWGAGPDATTPGSAPDTLTG